VGKPEGKRPLGRLRRKWVDNNKIYLREIAWDVMDYLDLVQNGNPYKTLLSTVKNFGFHKCWEVLEWLHNWRLLKKSSAPKISK
jgi:hypothetical protein